MRNYTEEEFRQLYNHQGDIARGAHGCLITKVIKNEVLDYLVSINDIYIYIYKYIDSICKQNSRL